MSVKRYRVIVRERFVTDFHDIEANTMHEAEAEVLKEIAAWREGSLGILGTDGPRFGENAGDSVLEKYSIVTVYEEDES